MSPLVPFPLSSHSCRRAVGFVHSNAESWVDKKFKLLTVYFEAIDWVLWYFGGTKNLGNGLYYGYTQSKCKYLLSTDPGVCRISYGGDYRFSFTPSIPSSFLFFLWLGNCGTESKYKLHEFMASFSL